MLRAANPILHAKSVISLVGEKTDRAILFYSGGKDSIVLLDLMSEQFKEIVCVFMYFVKGLEHIDKFINYSQKRYSNISFLQVPHYSLAHIYKYGIYCIPNKNITRKTTLSDIDEHVRSKTGLSYTFYGWKKIDGLQRRLTLGTYEMDAISTTNKVYPLSLWSHNDVFTYIKRKKLPTPVRYGKSLSNGVGFDEGCYVWMRDHYPNDLKKILKEFPLSERILYEYDNKVSVGLSGDKQG